jgi:hypothetical protein
MSTPTLAPPTPALQPVVEPARPQPAPASWPPPGDDAHSADASSVSRAFVPSLVSMVVHLALLIILGLWQIEAATRGSEVGLTSGFADEAILDALDATVAQPAGEVDASALASANLEGLAEADSLEAPADVRDTSGGATLDVSAAVSRGMVGKTALSGDTGAFFGVPAKGKKFVFVVDNSQSMGGRLAGSKRTKFERAIDELLESVEALGKGKTFYVVFFASKPTRLFDPEPAKELISANSDNYYKLFYWLKTVELVRQTKGQEAMQVALDLKPDAIFVLGDGAFTDRVVDNLPAMNKNKIPIHTLLFSSGKKGDKGEEAMRRIATEHNGTFTRVQ